LVAGRDVEAEQKDIDQYGRIVGLVKVDGQNSYAWGSAKTNEGGVTQQESTAGLTTWQDARPQGIKTL